MTLNFSLLTTVNSADFKFSSFDHCEQFGIMFSSCDHCEQCVTLVFVATVNSVILSLAL